MTLSFSRIMVLLAVAYAITIAILAVLNSDALVPFATIGALVIGGLWFVTGYLRRPR